MARSKFGCGLAQCGACTVLVAGRPLLHHRNQLDRAGFAPNRHNAANLAHSQHILTRISELLAEREKVHGQATAVAIERAALTKTWVIEKLIENVGRAMQHQPVLGAKGEVTGEYRYEGAVANRALELLGKELGMFISRSEVRTGPLDELDPDDIRRLREAALREKARRRAAGDGEEVPAKSPRRARGHPGGAAPARPDRRGPAPRRDRDSFGHVRFELFLRHGRRLARLVGKNLVSGSGLCTEPAQRCKSS